MQREIRKKTQYTCGIPTLCVFPNVKGKHYLVYLVHINLSYSAIFNSNSAPHRARPSVFMSFLETKTHF